MAFLVGYNDASIIEWGISSGNDIEARALLMISAAVALFCVAWGISNEKPGAMKIKQCTDGYPSCRNAEATGKFCEGHCKSEAFSKMGEYILNEDSHFVCGITAFNLKTGAIVKVTQIDVNGKKVLISFGERSCDWFPSDILKKFTKK